jgi:hypothetical protein
VTDKFDVLAETDSNAGLNQPTSRKMLQQLLAGRSLSSRLPSRKELSICEIVSANEELKLAKSPAIRTVLELSASPGLGEMVVKNATIAEFANFLQRYVLDRPVLDESGIEGRYQFKLDCTANESQFIGRTDRLPAPSRDVEPPDLFTAVEEGSGPGPCRRSSRKAHRKLSNFPSLICIDQSNRMWGQGFGPAADLPVGAEHGSNPAQFIPVRAPAGPPPAKLSSTPPELRPAAGA